MKTNLLNIILISFLALFIYVVFIRSPQGKSGEEAPNFEAELISGEKFELNDLKGKYVLLDFWGSWCGPCRRDNPNLVKLHNEFNTEDFVDAEGFEIVTVALEKNDRTWKRAAEKDGFIWKHQIVQESRIVLLSPVAQKYAVSDIPAKFLIDPKGKIIGVNQKYSEIRQQLAERRKKS